MINSDYDSLVMNCNIVLIHDSLNTDALFLKGFGLENEGQFDEAIDIYKLINQIRKNDNSNMSITIAEIKKKKAFNNGHKE